MLRQTIFTYVQAVTKEIIATLIVIGQAVHTSTYVPVMVLVGAVVSAYLTARAYIVPIIGVCCLIASVVVWTHSSMWSSDPPEDTNEVVLVQPDDYKRLVFIPHWMSDSDKALKDKGKFSRQHVVRRMFSPAALSDKKYPAHGLVKACTPGLKSAENLVDCVTSKLKAAGYASYKKCVHDMSLTQPATLFVVNVCLSVTTDLNFVDTAETTPIRDDKDHIQFVLFDDDI